MDLKGSLVLMGQACSGWNSKPCESLFTLSALTWGQATWLLSSVDRV
jgi:hypothetical protein